MSVLDFVESPAYQIVGVALSKDDVTLFLNVKPEQAKVALETAIKLLQNELDVINQSVLYAVTPKEISKC
jgi:hypothetical protein